MLSGVWLVVYMNSEYNSGILKYNTTNYYDSY